MSLIELILACGERLHVHRFSIREEVSSPFAVKVLARSPDPCVDLRAILGQPAALRILSGYRYACAGERVWSGICNHVRQVQAIELRSPEVGLSTYEISIAPRLWLLSQRTNHRIFRHLSTPEIARKLLKEWRIDDTVFRIDAAEYPRTTYRVQYGETDLDFLSRLLEETGIAYTFTDDEGDLSRLVLSDALQLSAPRREIAIPYIESPTEAAEREFVTRVSIDEQIRPDAVTIRDYDFHRPALTLVGEARISAATATGCLERYAYRPGGFLIERDASAPCHDVRHGGALAARALEAERAGCSSVSFETNAIDLRPGTLLLVEGHPRPELDPSRGLLITSLAIDGSPNGDWTTRATAVLATEPYRPSPRTPKPRVYGVQSAMVVGPPGQEIHTDEHGRVRVQFPWDREGTLNEESSCWLRVSQGWAGAGFGLFALPRVGQEVLVAFLEGDPDQPIVMGRAANALNPLPVRLPDDRTQSAWRSSSSPGGEGFNEIRFEDRKGAELVAIQAERDLRKLVKRDEATIVGRDRTTIIQGNETATTTGRQVVIIGEDQDIVIQKVHRERVDADVHRATEGDVRERIGGTYSLTAGRQQIRVAGDAALEANGEIHIKAGTRLVLEAPDITLKGSGGFLRVDGGGVKGLERHLLVGGGPATGKGAHPALPEEPAHADTERAPRRLPLIGFPGLGPPRLPSAPPAGAPPPLTPDEVTLCGIICSCKVDPAPNTRPSDCVTRKLRALDAASGGMSKLKAEVPYDMSKSPPAPVMSRKEPGRPSTGKHPKGSRAPDVILVKDPTRPPTQDNIEKVIEIKYPPDRLSRKQKEQYEVIAGDAPFEVFGPERCGCSDERKRREVTAEEVATAAALTVLLIALLLARQPGPAGRLLDKLAPLLSRLLPTLSR